MNGQAVKLAAAGTFGLGVLYGLYNIHKKHSMLLDVVQMHQDQLHVVSKAVARLGDPEFEKEWDEYRVKWRFKSITEGWG